MAIEPVTARCPAAGASAKMLLFCLNSLDGGFNINWGVGRI